MSNYYNDQWRLPNNENKDKQSNYSMDFDGTQLVSQGVGNFTSFNGVSECSVSLWFKSSTSQGPYKWFFNVPSNTSGSHGFGIYASGTGLTSHVFTTSRVEVVTSFSGNQWDGNWHHLVLTYKDGVGLRLYYDSVLQFTNNTMSGTITAGGEELAVGGFSTDYPTGNNIIAQIDGVSAFTYALSSSQVTTLYGSSSTGIGNPMSLSPKPVAYYPLGDQDAFNGAEYLVPNSSLKDFVFNFDGSFDCVNITNHSSLVITGNITISAWIKTSVTGFQKIINKRDSGGTNYDFYLSSADELRFYDGDSAISSSGTINLSSWNHVAISIDSGTGTFYINGVSSGTASFTITSDDAPLYIGKYFGAGDLFNGELSNIQVFNTALSSTELETLYNNGSPIQTLSDIPQNSNLQGWWKLDASATYDSSTTTWTIPDDSTNSNTGTSSGMNQANLVQSDLSFTSGYSPFALNFDGTNDKINLNSDISLTGNKTVSFWFKAGNINGNNVVIGGNQLPTTNYYPYITSTAICLRDSTGFICLSGLTFNNDEWYHFCIVGDGTTATVYINGQSQGTLDDKNPTINTIGAFSNSASPFNGSLSNISIWNTNLSASQVSEIYSEGIPQNLNNHSAYSNLVSWWQLGSNTSWVDPYWIALDEKGTNNGESQNVAAPNNMGENAIVDGVGSYANGLSSGMGGDEVIGDAPYSSSNSLSVNMDVLDRTDDTPN